MKLGFLCLFLFLFLNNYSQDLRDEWFYYEDSAIHETNGRKSLLYSKKLLKISQELNDNNLIARSYIEIAHDYNRLGIYSIALKNAINAANYYEKINNKSKLRMTYSLIGSIYAYTKDYKKSNKYYDKAIANFDTNDKLYILGGFYTNKGEIYRLTHKFDSALYYFEIADTLYKKNNKRPYKLALSNCNQGLAHLGLNNFLKADSLLQLAFDYYIPNKNYYAVTIAYYELAKKELERNNITEAKNYVIDMLEMAEESNITDQLRDGHLLMHDIAILEQDYKTANEHLKQHYIFKDSLINTKVVSQMAEQRAEFEIGRKQDEVDHFRTISKARATIAYTLAIGLFLIIGLALFLYRINKKRKAANIELKDKNQIIEHQLEEKEMLMREIHHRVKNNLQIISSIINLQNLRIVDPIVQEKFSEMQRRITAISAIHQKLYKSESISHISMKEYVTEIADSVNIAFKRESLTINYEFNIKDIKLNIESAVSIGLIVNELITNAFKYAFSPNQKNYLIVALKSQNDGCYLSISDSGPGFPENFNILESDSLGMRMVSLLSSQLNGELSVESDEGATFNIYFKGMQAF